MSNKLKYALPLLASALLLTACGSNDSTTSTSNAEAKQETKTTNLEEKINNKQKYITIQKYINEDAQSTKNKTSDFIEKVSNDMASKQYELKHQDLTFGKYGTIQGIILTFEYKENKSMSKQYKIPYINLEYNQEKLKEREVRWKKDSKRT